MNIMITFCSELMYIIDEFNEINRFQTNQSILNHIHTFELNDNNNNSNSNSNILVIQKRKLNNDEIFNKCSICLDYFIENYWYDQYIIELECEHIFHTDCIKKWLIKQPNCPLCRIKIT